MSEELTAGHHVVVLGLGLYGRSVTRALAARGFEVTVVEDKPTPTTIDFSARHGVGLVESPDVGVLGGLLESADAFMPSPGVPWIHPAFQLAAGSRCRVLSEFDLARWWDDRPVIAITGTDGKTTVTELAVAMLGASGIAAAAVGNTDLPMIDAIDSAEHDVLVVEASSFRLAHTERFSPRAAAWTNFAPDHLDVHRTLADYELAKARIWADLPVDGVAVANHDDPVVMAHVPAERRVITVGFDGGDARLDGRSLCVAGTVVAELDDLPRTFRHDVEKALTAAALALEVGATPTGIRAGLRSYQMLPHRIQPVAEIDGVRFVNDSKATAPHAVTAALRAFDSVVLIAGGQNKGLDLSPLRDAVDRIRGVVAIGSAAPDVVAAFAGLRPVVAAEDLDDAVRAAWKSARPGDVVLLSPGCASYDAYTSYGERGQAFVDAVTELKAEVGP